MPSQLQFVMVFPFLFILKIDLLKFEFLHAILLGLMHFSNVGIPHDERSESKKRMAFERLMSLEYPRKNCCYLVDRLMHI